MNQQSQEPLNDSEPLSLAASQISFGRIVVGYDPADGRDDIIKVADLLARELGAEILIVNAVAPVPSMLGVVGQTPESIALRIEEIRSLLEAELRQRGISAPFRVLVDRDSPADALVMTAREYRADLLIVGTPWPVRHRPVSPRLRIAVCGGSSGVPCIDSRPRI